MQLKVGTHLLRVLLLPALLLLASALALTEARHHEPVIFDPRPSPFNPNGPRTGGVQGGGGGFGGGRGGFGGGRW